MKKEKIIKLLNELLFNVKTDFDFIKKQIIILMILVMFSFSVEMAAINVSYGISNFREVKFDKNEIDKIEVIGETQEYESLRREKLRDERKVYDNTYFRIKSLIDLVLKIKIIPLLFLTLSFFYFSVVKNFLHTCNMKAEIDRLKKWCNYNFLSKNIPIITISIAMLIGNISNNIFKIDNFFLSNTFSFLNFGYCIFSIIYFRKMAFSYSLWKLKIVHMYEELSDETSQIFIPQTSQLSKSVTTEFYDNWDVLKSSITERDTFQGNTKYLKSYLIKSINENFLLKIKNDSFVKQCKENWWCIPAGIILSLPINTAIGELLREAGEHGVINYSWWVASDIYPITLLSLGFMIGYVLYSNSLFSNFVLLNKDIENESKAISFWKKDLFICCLVAIALYVSVKQFTDGLLFFIVVPLSILYSFSCLVSPLDFVGAVSLPFSIVFNVLRIPIVSYKSPIDRLLERLELYNRKKRREEVSYSATDGQNTIPEVRTVPMASNDEALEIALRLISKDGKNE